MADTQFVCPVEHLLGLVRPGTVTACGVDTQQLRIAAVAVLDDRDMVGHVPALHAEVPLVERIDQGSCDHRGVISTTIPPFGIPFDNVFLPVQFVCIFLQEPPRHLDPVRENCKTVRLEPLLKKRCHRTGICPIRVRRPRTRSCRHR